MWKNRRFLSVAIVAVCAGFVNTDLDGAVPMEFEGRFGLYEPLTVGITAGTADNPELVRIEWIRFDPVYANAWRATAHVGWLPVKETTWRFTIELLDSEGNVLRHSRDEPMVFTCKADAPGQTDMRYADLDLDAMMDQGRRHAARFRVLLMLSEERVTGEENHTLEVKVLDQESRESISDATVVISRSYLEDTFWRRDKALCVTDSQGRCIAKLAREGLTLIGVSAQKQDYCTIAKSWSNSGSWPLGRIPIVNLPQRHVLEMVRTSSLGGSVEDTQGNAIAGAEVYLDVHSAEPSGTIYVNRAVRTDADGRWRIDGIPGDAERFTLRVRHADYGGDNGRNRHISGDALVSARAFKHVVILEKGITIAGQVLDNQGGPVAGATVMLAQRSYNAVYSLTDASGAFRLVCSSDPSAYREAPSLIIEAPGYAPIQQNIDIKPNPEALEFHLKRGRSVTCHVVDTNGQPISGAWTVVEPLPDHRDCSVWLEDTDAHGEFQIPNAPQNDVKLTIGKEGYLAIRDHIVSASENEVVVTMKHAMRVHGTVTDTETGKPIPNFEIAAVYTTGGRTNTSTPVAFVEGIYEINFDEAQPETGQLKVFAVGYEPVTSKEIKIDEGEHAINFELARSASFDQVTAGRPREQISPTGPRRITGMIRDEQGEPVPDAVVVTYPRTGIETVTDAKGSFTLKLRGTQGSMGTMSREETTYLLVRQKQRNLAAALMLDTSADTINVILTPGVILSGKVVDVEGKGIPNAELSLTFWTSTVGYGSREAAEIDEAGNYEIRAIPMGQRYSVNASAAGYGERYVQVNTGEAENQRLEVEPLVLSIANLSASGIIVDDLDQPVSGLRIYAYGNGQPSRETFTDTQGRFTIENVCPGRINIQANSKVGSASRFHGQAQAEGGVTNIKIVAYEMDEHGRRVISQPPSLVGKSLPDLNELGLKISPDDIEGKRILVCFWDMNQRPSRHCMTQLAKQIEVLKQKDVVVVAVQVSKLDQNALDEWAKKFSIPFSAMTEGDAKKIRLSYGVQSLPWLILTDRVHIVFAGGFSLGELDEKLEQLGDK